MSDDIFTEAEMDHWYKVIATQMELLMPKEQQIKRALMYWKIRRMNEPVVIVEKKLIFT